MNINTYLKIFLSIVVTFGTLHVGSLVLFIYKPEIFYHRHLEYFADIALRVKGAPLFWHGPEQGDLGRRYLFTYADSYVTTVTVDEEGFRGRRLEADSYPVLVAGDSTIYGILLSDDETLPWRLSSRLGVPVFNGGRVKLSVVLAHPAIRETKIVIDGWTERNITPSQLEAAKLDLSTQYGPSGSRTLSLMDAVSEIPPRRYSLPFKMLNWSGRLFKDIKNYLRGGRQPYLFERHKMKPEDFDETVKLIVERSKAVEASGRQYVFLPVPAKQTFYATDVDDYTRDFIPKLVARLRGSGVEAVDLSAAFDAEKSRGLYFPYDTHWNGAATEIAATVLAREVFHKN